MSYQANTPQAILDDIHAANIPALFMPQMGQKQRLEAIQLAQADLKDAREALLAGINRIEKQHRKDDQKAAKASGGYRKVLELTEELIQAVDDLEKRVKSNKVLPQAFGFGRYIVGDEEVGEWHLGDEDTMYRWDDMMRVRLRLQATKKEIAPLEEKLTDIKRQMNEEKRNLDSLLKTYHKRSKKRYAFIRLMPVFVLGAILLAIGVYTALNNITLDTLITTDDLPEFLAQGYVLHFIAIGIGSIFILSVPLAYLRRQRWLKRTRDDIKQSRVRLREHQQAGKQVNQRYRPLQHSYREILAEYKQLKMSF
jgi:hypothetical protein